ncbi:MAG: hypothetical protein RLZZ159_748 [Actinomycetota bacterium]|jgi:hypothetical protein
MTQYVVGAYPASIAHRNWDPVLESDFFELLANDKRVDSLELPWLGKIHPRDVGWLHNNFPKNLKAVITSIPFVMGQLSKDSNYGLASPSEDSRQKAVSDVKVIYEAIKEFDHKTGRKTVSAIEIHTAPREVGNVVSLAKSLAEISAWDWEGTEILIEHCDAFVAGQTPEKGFLSLGQEIEAIKSSAADVGILINWGRSAIEFRDANRVIEHVELAKDSGLLKGLIFSGASDKQGLFGYPWIDAHHPFIASEINEFGDPDSLLTEGRAKAAIQIAGQLPYLGIKMGWPNEVMGSVAQRYQLISDALDILNRNSR